MGKQTPDEETPTMNITMRNVDLQVYFRLRELKKKGKFPSWDIFLKWLTNNKSLADTFADELEKRLKEMEKNSP